MTLTWVLKVVVRYKHEDTGRFIGIVQKGKNCQIWCDGLRGDNSVNGTIYKQAKRKSPDTSTSSVASKKRNSSQEKRDEKVAK